MLDNGNPTGNQGSSDRLRELEEMEKRYKSLSNTLNGVNEGFENLKTEIEGSTDKVLSAIPVLGDFIIKIDNMGVGFRQSYAQMEAGAIMLMRTMGQGRSRIVEFENAAANAIPEVMKVGGTAKDAVTTMEDVIKGTRTNIVASAKDVAEIFSAAQVLGQTTEKITTSFVNVGTSITEIGETTKQSVDYVRSLGANTKQVMASVLDNIESVNRYNFEGGVLGLTKMATQATTLRFDMNETFTLAEKVMKPEKAVEVAAAFQRLGVMAGDLVDPFSLMNKSINDPQGLQDSLINVAKQFAYFDEETKSFRISPQGMLTLREMGEQTGVSAKEMSKTALAAAELDRKLSEISPDINIPEEDKKYLANIAKMGEGGKYEVEISPLNKVQLETLNEEELKELIRKQKELDKPIEDIQKDQLTALKTANDQLNAIKESLRLGAITSLPLEGMESMGRVARVATTAASDIMPTPAEIQKFIKGIDFSEIKKTIEEKGLGGFMEEMEGKLKQKGTGMVNALDVHFQKAIDDAKTKGIKDDSLEMKFYQGMKDIIQSDFFEMNKGQTTQPQQNQPQQNQVQPSNSGNQNTGETELLPKKINIPGISSLNDNIKNLNATLKNELKVENVSDIKNMLAKQSEERGNDVPLIDPTIQNQVTAFSNSLQNFMAQQTQKPTEQKISVDITSQFAAQELKVHDDKLKNEMGKIMASYRPPENKQEILTATPTIEQKDTKETLQPHQVNVKVDLTSVDNLTAALKNFKIDDVNVEVLGMVETKDTANNILEEMKKPRPKIQIEGLTESLQNMVVIDTRPNLETINNTLNLLPDKMNKDVKLTGLEPLTESLQNMVVIDTRPNLETINNTLNLLPDKMNKDVKLTGWESLTDILRPVDLRPNFIQLNETLTTLANKIQERNPNKNGDGLTTRLVYNTPIPNRLKADVELPQDLQVKMTNFDYTKLQNPMLNRNETLTTETQNSLEGTNNIISQILEEVKKPNQIEGIETLTLIATKLENYRLDLNTLISNMKLPTREIYQTTNNIEKNSIREIESTDYQEFTRNFFMNLDKIVNYVNNRNLERVESPNSKITEESIQVINKTTKETQEIVMGGTSTIVFKIDTTSAPNVDTEQVKQIIDRYLNQTNFKEYITGIIKDKETSKGVPTSREYSIRG